MSSLPNEIFFDISNFLPNDDITDLMLMSRTFNALVTPRLQKINQEMTTMNQSIESFMPTPAPHHTDNDWIAQLNLKKFEPIGSEAKKRMEETLKNEDEFQQEVQQLRSATLDIGMLDGLKKRMSLERFDDRTFLRVLTALVAMPKFRQKFDVSYYSGLEIIKLAHHLIINRNDFLRSMETLADLRLIWTFYNPESCSFQSK